MKRSAPDIQAATRSSASPPPAGAASVVRDERLGLALVARGDGPADMAMAAAQLTLDAVRGHLSRHRDSVDRMRRASSPDLRHKLVEVVREAFGRACREVFALGQRQGRTLRVSLDLILLVGDECFVGHVGDGRVYLVRRGLLHQLSASRGGEAGAAEEPQPNRPGPGEERAAASVGRPEAPGGMGAEPTCRMDTICLDLVPGDTVVAVSSDVVDRLGEEDLRRIIAALPQEGLVDALLAQVDERPGAPVAAASAGLPGVFVAGEARNRLALLARMPLFAYCTEGELLAVAQVALPRTHSAGVDLVVQGQFHQEVWLLVEGQAIVVRDGRAIAAMGPGSNFGEMSMLDDPHASATVRATTDVEALVVPREAFLGLLRADPRFSVKVLWNMLLRLSANLRRTSARLAEVQTELDQAAPLPKGLRTS